MSIEDVLVENVKSNYTKALTNKVYLDNIKGLTLNLDIGSNKSLYVFGGNNNLIDIGGKCNHIFMYNCNNMNMKVDDCVSGITCMNCSDCNLLCKRTPLYNIEMSNSFNMNVRSLFFNMPVTYNCVTTNIIKSIDCVVQEYYMINDGLYSNWNCNFFNF